jgi:hypothetical protein
MAAVNPHVLAFGAARASLAVGMEPCDEFGGAGDLVPIIDRGEVQGHDLQATRVSTSRRLPLGVIVKSGSTGFPS